MALSLFGYDGIKPFKVKSSSETMGSKERDHGAQKLDALSAVRRRKQLSDIGKWWVIRDLNP
jgi:hypothetical protein